MSKKQKPGKISSFFHALVNTSAADIGTAVKNVAVDAGNYAVHVTPASIGKDVKKVFHDVNLQSQRAKLELQNQATNAKMQAGLFLIQSAVTDLGLTPEALAHLLKNSAVTDATVVSETPGK